MFNDMPTRPSTMSAEAAFREGNVVVTPRVAVTLSVCVGGGLGSVGLIKRCYLHTAAHINAPVAMKNSVNKVNPKTLARKPNT